MVPMGSIGGLLFSSNKYERRWTCEAAKARMIWRLLRFHHGVGALFLRQFVEDGGRGTIFNRTWRYGLGRGIANPSELVSRGQLMTFEGER